MIARRHRNHDLRSAAVVAISVILGGSALQLRAAITPADWRNQQSMEISDTGLTKIGLPDSTLDLARVGLADLRLLGPNGEDVPYAIQIPEATSATKHSARNVRIELQPFSTQITIETGTTQPADGVVLTTPARAFVKAARVEISANSRDWELVGQGFQIARQPGLEALTVPLSKTSAAFIRITIEDARSAVVPFTGAILTLAARESSPLVPVKADITRRDEFAGESVLAVDLHARHLPLTLLEIATSDPLFARAVEVKERTLRAGESTEQTMAVGSIFRSPLPDQAAREHLRVPLDHTTSLRQQQIHITNNESPPLTIEHITLMRRPVWMIFNATSAGSYRLLTGNDHVSAPSYDIAELAAHWQTLPEATIVVSEPKPNPGYLPSGTPADGSALGATLDVGAWKFRKAITLATTGVQQLELDLEVLAHAQRDLSDLRLIRAGRQVPYLLERSSLVRTLAVKSVDATDPKPPQLSRWKLILPLARLPVQKLTLSSPTPLFSRSLQVYELTPDQRGERSRRFLSDRISWSSTPDQPQATKTIDLVAPLDEVLYLEIDNADNPPIVLGEIRAEYSVVRLFFRAEGEPLHLYYGATHVPAPRYDIELVAPRLLNEERHSAMLNSEENTDGRSAGTFLSEKQGGIALWVSLAIVVGVLLFAIARLLPKSPDPTP